MTAAAAFLVIAVGDARPAWAARRGEDLAFAQQQIFVRESSGRVLIEIRRPPTFALEESEASYTTASGTGYAGGATADTDYIAGSGRVRLGVGETGKTVSIPLIDDAEEEADEAFLVRLTDPHDGSKVIDEVVVNVSDDDYFSSSGATWAAPQTNAPRANASTGGDVTDDASQVTGRRVRSVKRVRTIPPPEPAAPRITPFHLHRPRSGDAAGATSPAVAPVAAAGILAALFLGRVTAEVWFRWRMREG